jgi:plastocyanin
MYKALSILGLVVLLGAGCAGSGANPQNQSASADAEMTQDADISSQKSEETETSSSDGSVETSVNVATPSQEQTLFDDEQDVAITFETEADTETEAEDDGVVEIILGQAPDVEVDLESGNFFFKQDVITANAGDRVKVNFINNSGFHTFVIDESNTKVSVSEGESLTFVAPSMPGSYAFYCDIGSHRAQGMHGTLIVK